MRKGLLFALLALLCGAPKTAHALSDGTPSTGAFTIVTNSALSAATASGTTAIVTVTDLTGANLSIGPYVFKAGRDFAVGASTAATATSLKNAINASGAPVTAAYSAGDASIALTAKSSGSLYNSVALLTSDSNKISVGAAALSGGQDNAIVYINSIPLVAGRDFFVQDVASNTAVNLAGAINMSLALKPLVNAQQLGAGSAVVYLRSALVPTAAYTLSDSAGTAITETNPTMVGGSAGNIIVNPCFLGVVNALPTANYPKGCLLYLSTAPTKIYISTQDVTGDAAHAANSWLAIP